jgi:hypothetical protein
VLYVSLTGLMKVGIHEEEAMSPLANTGHGQLLIRTAYCHCFCLWSEVDVASTTIPSVESMSPTRAAPQARRRVVQTARPGSCPWRLARLSEPKDSDMFLTKNWTASIHRPVSLEQVRQGARAAWRTRSESLSLTFSTVTLPSGNLASRYFHS